ncbi:PIG-L deacetylase family protein [Brumimicrobium oceani]|uniref:GlcNAc-PI de-N-acetylase n=1 Tax=Brumimicrobium oceani TaxID=2100725 RepID=A0A2U2XF76_9FLAO|nr:PIG-L deacetylase family protein [Brumimicrobium oceani]PWH86407.1 GlcNAc-PI de-N-acetylase [Brumimicrobium oceani]
MSKNIVIISAHPDDEVLGVGGTLLKHKKNGDEIYWIITTSIFEENGFSNERVNSRQIEINEVAERIGAKAIYKLDYPTMSLSSETLIDMVPKISEIFSEVKPEVIYCLNRSDAHSDHRVTFDAVMACTKSFRYPYIKSVLMYECISETEFAPALPEKTFMPNYFVDISEFMDEKIDIMKIYHSELGEHPFPRSIRNIEALATFRGASVGVEYAEAFQLVKYIDK